MDPIQAIAAHHVTSDQSATPRDIDVFYDVHACEGLHRLKNAMRRVARTLYHRGMRVSDIAPSASKIARMPRQA